MDKLDKVVDDLLNEAPDTSGGMTFKDFKERYPNLGKVAEDIWMDSDSYSFIDQDKIMPGSVEALFDFGALESTAAELAGKTIGDTAADLGLDFSNDAGSHEEYIADYDGEDALEFAAIGEDTFISTLSAHDDRFQKLQDFFYSVFEDDFYNAFSNAFSKN